MPYIDIVDADKHEARSEGGGNHITLSAADFDAGELKGITSGDLVVLTDTGLCGVALIDYNTATDEVVIDITGCHWLPVNDDVEVGSRIYYDKDAAELHAGSGDNDIFVGFSLAADDSYVATAGYVATAIDVPVRLWPFGEGVL